MAGYNQFVCLLYRENLTLGEASIRILEKIEPHNKDGMDGEGLRNIDCAGAMDADLGSRNRKSFQFCDKTAKNFLPDAFERFGLDIVVKMAEDFLSVNRLLPSANSFKPLRVVKGWFVWNMDYFEVFHFYSFAVCIIHFKQIPLKLSFHYLGQRISMVMLISWTDVHSCYWRCMIAHFGFGQDLMSLLR